MTGFLLAGIIGALGMAWCVRRHGRVLIWLPVLCIAGMIVSVAAARLGLP
jgi:hypothetical protein